MNLPHLKNYTSRNEANRLRGEVESLCTELTKVRADRDRLATKVAQCQEIGRLLIAVARAAWELADNTEEGVTAHGTATVTVDYEDWNRLSKSLDPLDELPNPPGECSTGPRKAEAALSDAPPKSLIDESLGATGGPRGKPATVIHGKHVSQYMDDEFPATRGHVPLRLFYHRLESLCDKAKGETR